MMNAGRGDRPRAALLHRGVIAMRAQVIFAAVLSLLPFTASADATNAPINLTLPGEPFDATKVTWLAQDALNLLTTYHNDFVAGKTTGYAFAASPFGYYGIRQGFPGGAKMQTVELARGALEQCEWWNGMPCYLIGVNGIVPRDANGDYLAQPHMLDPEPKAFDYARVPFVRDSERRQLRDYYYLGGNKALALSDNGIWAYRSSDTIAGAVTDAMAGCKEATGGYDCNLYAVNRMLVMDFTR
jgi:hypothetical protein